MTKPLPVCAYCGNPMLRGGRIVIRYRGIQVGWHAWDAKDSCSTLDPIRPAQIFDTPGLLETIKARGPGRVR